MRNAKFDPVQDAYIQECGYRETSFGLCLYIKIRRFDERPMSWTQVWQTFNDSYPGQWAFEMFPPECELVDEANIYHLFVLRQEPDGVNIRR
jgi:hypothetical protein